MDGNIYLYDEIVGGIVPKESEKAINDNIVFESIIKIIEVCFLDAINSFKLIDDENKK